jgi:hypothetical protein
VVDDINPSHVAQAFEATINDLNAAIAMLRAERNQLTAGNAQLAAQRDQLSAEITEREKQLAAQKQVEILRDMSALDFLQRCAEVGADQDQLQVLADSVAAPEPTEPGRTAE